MPPLERQLPLPEMSAAQLARYRRALVRYFSRCREEQPQYQEMHGCLADVMARSKRAGDRPNQRNHAGGAVYLHVNERISTAPWTAASIRVVTCGAARKPGVARSDPEVDPGVRVEADFTGDHLLHLAAAGCVLDVGMPDSP